MRVKRLGARARGYTAKWEGYAKAYLKKHPWCKLCLRANTRTRATVVDHIRPHRGEHALFWSTANHQALCTHCHNSHKKRLENGNVIRLGCDASGRPLDSQHHWSTEKDRGRGDQKSMPGGKGPQGAAVALNRNNFRALVTEK